MVNFQLGITFPIDSSSSAAEKHYIKTCQHIQHNPCNLPFRSNFSMLRLHLVPWNLQMAVKPCLEHLRSRGATVSLLKIPSSTSQLSDFKLYNASHTELLLHKTAHKTGPVLLKQDIQICCPVFLQGTNKWFLSEFLVLDLTASGACVVCNVRDT